MRVEEWQWREEGVRSVDPHCHVKQADYCRKVKEKNNELSTTTKQGKVEVWWQGQKRHTQAQWF